jgi:hypothetical protein
MQRKADINYQANIKRYSTNQLGENWTELRESQNSSGITLSWLILRNTLPSRFPGRLKTEAAELALHYWLSECGFRAKKKNSGVKISFL